ncbi:hypothetical protein ES705_13473 [subsurface metagenome]
MKSNKSFNTEKSKRKMKQQVRYLKMNLILILLFSAFQLGFSQVQNTDNKVQKLDADLKVKIIEEIVGLIEEKYVFTDDAKKITNYMQEKQKEKAYDHITTLQGFIREITKDLRAVNNDAHLGLGTRRGSFKTGVSPEEMFKTIYLKRAPFQNYGFKKVDRLLGNVGCIVLDEFSYVEMDGENVGGETARAVMKVISNSYALIIDLRDNFGGREEMALLLLDYFFEKPTHILTNQYRGRKDKQIRTKGEHAEGRLDEIPLYVLTSRHTISGGEMFAYVLKNRKRATIIGEKTRGAAHRTHLFSLQSAKIDIAIPVGTTIDPVTGTDWEGKGVEPDIAVSSGMAMDVAYKKALEEIMQGDVDEMERNEIEWTLMEVEANVNPIILDESSLQEYVGVFGERKSTLEKGALIYQREGQTVYELAPMSKDIFSFVDKGMFYVRIRFGRNELETIDKMILIYDTGQKREYSKTNDR